MDDWIAEFTPQLLYEGGADIVTLASVVQRLERIDQRDSALAAALTSSDVIYLNKWHIDKIILDEIDDLQLSDAVRETKRRYARIASMFPHIISRLSRQNNFTIRYCLQVLNDISRDFDVPVDSPRRDKILNDRIRKLSQIGRSAGAFIDTLRAASDDHELAMEYQNLVASLYEMGRDLRGDLTDDDPMRQFARLETLIANLNTLVSAIEVTSIDLRSEAPRSPIRDYKMKKADVVAFAYDLHLVCGGPPLVTTPGSEFSSLCSLIYEVCTGEADQSLAGAIIAFSKSRERREADENEADIENDEAAYESSDNFYLIEKSRLRSIRSAEWYRGMAENSGVTGHTLKAIQSAIESSLRHAERTELAYGPFIVWASQDPRLNQPSGGPQEDDQWERVREARIRLGELRRAVRAKLRPSGQLPEDFD